MNESAQKLITELYWEEGTAIAHAESKGNCEYCGDDLLNSWKSYSAMEIDHLLPKFVYEEHRFNYSNYVTSCSTCNQLKRQFDPLMEGESAMSMLEENRSKLIERVRDQLQKKYDLREREFETVKSIIVG